MLLFFVPSDEDENPARGAKCLKDNNYKASILRENVLLYLSLNVICSSKLAVFPRDSLSETVRILEQIMSADKYPFIFSHQIEATVCI